MPNLVHAFDFELKEQALAKSLIKPGMTAFDVGANIGHFTRLYSDLVGNSGHVYSFEPTAEIFGRLKKNAQAANTTMVNTALYSSTGTSKFYEFESGFEVFNSLRVPHTDHKPVRQVIVQTQTLLAFCQQNKILSIDFLKVDTEGAELEIFKGAEKLLNQKRIGYIQFEISQAFLAGFKLKPLQVFDYLWGHGYECHVINSDGSTGDAIHDTDVYQDNFVAFPERE